jgi:uncharacterized protein
VISGSLAALAVALAALAQLTIVLLLLRRTRTSRLHRLWKGLVGLGIVGMVGAIASEYDFSDPVFDHAPGWLPGVMQTAMSLWIVCSTIALFLYGIIRIRLRKAPVNGGPSRRIFLRAATGVTLAAPFAAAAIGGIVERTRIETTELKLALPGLPTELQGLRLLQLSDIHLSPYLSAKTLAYVIGLSNELKPDIVFVTGDLITTIYDPLDECLLQIAGLRTRYGIFGCHGNHEAHSGLEERATTEGARMGIQFLRGERRTIRIGSVPLHISGVDYEPFSNRSKYLQNAERLVAAGGINILMSHNPDVFPTAAEKGFDLTLAGHTHGGQVTTDILPRTLNPARLLTPFVSGLYRHGQRYCYVNRGIGTIGIPVRLGCPPEITLIQLARG